MGGLLKMTRLFFRRDVDGITLLSPMLVLTQFGQGPVEGAIQVIVHALDIVFLHKF
jgi:hypothetical protein